MKGLVDSTLREGSQTVGVAFTLEQKVSLAHYLAQVGIEEVEVGIVSPQDHELPDLVSRCRNEAGISRLGLWCRCREDDIACALRLKPDVLSLSVPVSDLHIRVKLGLDRGAVIKMVARAVAKARDAVGYVSLGLEDATRAESGFLREIIAVACENGVSRIRIADTVGVATPGTIAALVRELRTFKVEIGVHMHNDFGMATANGIAALEAGAHWADVTVLGLGERAGNSRLEEVAGYLALQSTRPYDTTLFRPLALLAGECAGRNIAPHHPVVGTEIFACETGLHLAGLARNPTTYEPYSPGLVGAERKLIYGGKIGRRGMIERLHQLGVQVQEAQVGRLADSFRSQCRALGRPLHDPEVLRLVAEQGA
ncbi:MAG: pyruvate carboxyltransferase [Desulfurivibrio sp.]|nr:pyruvate carboxyltransferase [Desulfurivibrio sp.]MBU4034708.1 pyruvate carboxyltransferase [Pseudomonadota bacterium]MBU4118105.1 pyruvate carboxyltransferase [Pseudomonadota bacterium]